MLPNVKRLANIDYILESKTTCKAILAQRKCDYKIIFVTLPIDWSKTENK